MSGYTKCFSLSVATPDYIPPFLTVLLIAVSAEIICIVVWVMANLVHMIKLIKVKFYENILFVLFYDVLLSTTFSLPFATSWILIFLLMAGSSHKPTGLIIGLSIAFVTILVIGGLLLFWCKGRHKGYKREVFVDVAGLCSIFGQCNVLLIVSCNICNS